MTNKLSNKNLLDKETTAYVLNLLRKGTIAWGGRAECLKLAREAVFEGRITQKGKKVFKYYWKCAHCQNLFRNESDMEVDHIDEIGTFKGDWNVHIKRIFCGQDNLQALCVGCHLKKTSFGNAKARFKRKGS